MSELYCLRQRVEELEKSLGDQKGPEKLLSIQREVAVALNNVTELEDGLKLCIDAAISVSEMDCGGVYLFDEVSGKLELAFTMGLSSDFITYASSYDKHSENFRIVNEGRPIYKQHKNLSMPLSKNELREGLLATAVVPIRYSGRIIGCFNLASHECENLGFFSRLAIEVIAAQIGGAILRLRIQETLRIKDNAVESSISPFVIADLEGKLNDVNSSFLKAWGYDEKKEILGRHVRDFWEKPETIDDTIRHIEQNDYWFGELIAKRKDGSPFVVQVSTSIIKDKLDKSVGMMASFVDITKRVKAEQDLRSERDRYESLMEGLAATGIGVDIVSVNYHVLWQNRALSEKFGDMTGKLCYESYMNLTKPCNFCPMRKAITRNRVEKVERLAADGRNYELFSAPLPNPDGTVDKVIEVILDITDMKRADKDLKKANRKTSNALNRIKRTQEQVVKHERLAALGQMARGIAHDFNNALVPIVGYTDLLLSNPKNFDNKKDAIGMLEEIRTAAKDAAMAVSRMREFYRPSEGFEKIKGDLNNVIKMVVDHTQPRWREEMAVEGAFIKTKMELEDIPPVAADESQLREALTNLILNAVDAMPEGGTITIRSYKRCGQAFLEVCDTGEGMTEEVRRKCLEPFFTTKKKYGTGMGLSMVYGIVQRHDGTLDIRSTPGKGTTIVVGLPFSTCVGQEKEPSQIQRKHVKPIRILFVDDDDANRIVVTKCLDTDKHTVETAESGKEGLKKFKEGKFDLVIVDRAMPDMSGDQLASEIKEMAPETPVIMLTGFGEIMADKGELPFGVDKIVSKPVSLSKLCEAVAVVVNRQS